MKKAGRITFVVMGVLILSLTGCGNGKNLESNEEITAENEEMDEADDIALAEIGIESATQLVKEKIGDEYRIEYTGTVENSPARSVQKDSEEDNLQSKYYIFSVSKDNEPLVKEIAVQVLSGEIFSYDVEAGVQDYSEFPLYDEEKDEVVSWEGQYSNEKFIIELIPGDTNSFEFVITNTAKEEIITAAAMTDGNSAVFSNEGYELNFEISGKNLSVKETSTENMKFELDGEYQKNN